MSSNSRQIQFGSGSIFRLVLQTSFPMFVAQLLNLLYSIVDRIYIGRIPGEGTASLAGIGLCFPVIILTTAFTNMFGMGGSPLFAMELGKNRAEEACKIMNTAARQLLITSVIILAAGEVLAEPVLYLFGADENSIVFALPYLRIYLLGTTFSMLSTGLNPYINAQGFPRTGMLTVIIGALSNLVLDPVFIFGLHLDVEGAAIATVLSQGLSAMFVIRFLTGRRCQIQLVKPKMEFPYGKDIAGLGTAPFIMWSTNALVSIACNGVLARVGGSMYVSVMTIVSSVRQVLETPVQAITEGASPIVSYNYGASKPSRVRRAIVYMTVICVLYTLLMWILVETKTEFFVKIFSRDEDLMPAAVNALHLYFHAFVFQALQACGQTVFKGLNKKKRAIFFSLFRKVILVVPLTLLLPLVFGFGTDGVFMAEPVSNFVGGLACYTTMLLTIMPELRRMKETGDDENIL